MLHLKPLSIITCACFHEVSSEVVELVRRRVSWHAKARHSLGGVPPLNGSTHATRKRAKVAGGIFWKKSCASTSCSSDSTYRTRRWKKRCTTAVQLVYSPSCRWPKAGFLTKRLGKRQIESPMPPVSPASFLFARVIM